MNEQARQGFWREAFARQGSVVPRVLPLVLTFGLIAIVIWGFSRLMERRLQISCVLEITPFEFAGAALGVLLVFRTNAGYDRWWEARKLWGGFVDRSRNIAISALTYGPNDSEWRKRFVKLVAAYPHVARNAIRGEGPGPEVSALLGADECQALAEANHMPIYICNQLAELLHDACDRFGLSPFAFLQIDRDRVLLLDHYGACERIRNTPVPRAYSLKIRHFIFLFLVSLPVALLHRLQTEWLIPLVTMLVAYPLLSLDQLGVELENPFATENLSHLPLGRLSSSIEANVLALLEQPPPRQRPAS